MDNDEALEEFVQILGRIKNLIADELKSQHQVKS
jgi:hypothetical protein